MMSEGKGEASGEIKGEEYKKMLTLSSIPSLRHASRTMGVICENIRYFEVYTRIEERRRTRDEEDECRRVLPSNCLLAIIRYRTASSCSFLSSRFKSWSTISLKLQEQKRN